MEIYNTTILITFAIANAPDMESAIRAADAQFEDFTENMYLRAGELGIKHVIQTEREVKSCRHVKGKMYEVLIHLQFTMAHISSVPAAYNEARAQFEYFKDNVIKRGGKTEGKIFCIDMSMTVVSCEPTEDKWNTPSEFEKASLERWATVAELRKIS